MTITYRTLALALLGLLVLGGCSPDRNTFAQSDDDDAANDDDAGPDDDDAGPDDDDSVDFDPNCEVTVDGLVSASPPDGLTSLMLFSHPERDTNEDGFALSGDSIEVLEVPNVTLPFQYRVCGVEDGTVIIGFLFDPNTDMCEPGNMHGALFIDPTTEPGLLGQDLMIEDVLAEDDCPRDGEPPP